MTDSDPTSQKAGELVVGQAPLRHVLLLRCFLEAFDQVAGSILGHAFASSVAASAQHIVHFVHASHRVQALLKIIAGGLGIHASLEAANGTQLSSVYGCLVSVLRLEKPLKMLVQSHADAFGPATGLCMCWV